MGKYKTIRVYPDGAVWVVKKDTASKASAIKYTKEEALKAAREIALNQNLIIIVHGKDGRIQKTIKPTDSSSNDGCFITTSCIDYYGLNDNCYQLETLREFRDQFLLSSDSGKQMVSEYYSIAPHLVAQLENDINKDSHYKEIFDAITIACMAIEKKDYNMAISVYKNIVQKLKSKYQD